MLRRVHLASLSVGLIPLPIQAAHHIRNVLRLAEGDLIELFDNSGNVSTGILKHVNPANVVVEVESIQPPVDSAAVIVASAIPKGDRADWMIEKLAEIGVTRFIPLAAQHSVTLPGGQNKIQRWERIAIEAARQSRRVGTLSIAPLTALTELLDTARPGGWFMSTAPEAIPMLNLLNDSVPGQMVLIGPEGGWSSTEIQRMKAAGFQDVALTSTVLRVETAAVVAAGLLCLKLRSRCVTGG